MIGRIGASMLITGAVLWGGTVMAQQEQEAPKLTPEQEAEMEAYQKAGTPGAPHEAMAATAGNYSVKTKSWS